MGREVHVVVLILLSIFEVWMCYQVLYRTVLDKKYLRTWQKVLIWVNILGVGILLGINRNILFFSHTVFYVSILITAIFICNVVKKDKLVNIEIEVLFFTGIALLDFFTAFISMHFIGKEFYYSVYKFSGEDIQIMIFLFPRGGMAFFLYKWRACVQKIREYRIGLAFLCLIFLILLREYQITLGYMALGVRTMKGWVASISMIIVFSIVLSSFIFFYKFKLLKKENEMLYIREELSKKHLEEMEKLMEQHRIQIHDMKKHLLILKEYGKSHDWEELLKYLNELSNEINQGKEKFWTQNRILNMVLEQEIDKAKKFDIEFKMEEVKIGILPFNDTEICALFGNLLDNAIEACCKMNSEKKWIEMKVWRKSQMLYIVVSNSIEIKPEEKNGKLISDKPDKALHGYGLKSVQKIVKKYNGEFEYQIKEKEFWVEIVFFILE